MEEDDTRHDSSFNDHIANEKKGIHLIEWIPFFSFAMWSLNDESCRVSSSSILYNRQDIEPGNQAFDGDFGRPHA